jgi:acyl-CoA thioesterase II
VSHEQYAPFLSRLDLTQVDRDIFTGQCHAGSPLRAYGGQIAAQSLMAAGATVEGDARQVHSLHGYFLRPGRSSDQITYLVERPRDGRSFSTRIVRAVQHGETIFMMTASFALVEQGPMHQFAEPKAPLPDDVAAILLPRHVDLNEEETGLHSLESQGFELRIIEPDKAVPLRDGRYEGMSWVRIPSELPHEQLIQASALTYLSDLTMVSTALGPHGGKEVAQDLMLASIDHAVWFHAPINTNEWMLFAQDSPVARGGHGLARGLFYDLNGILVASVVQESLLRTRLPR